MVVWEAAEANSPVRDLVISLMAVTVTVSGIGIGIVSWFSCSLDSCFCSSSGCDCDRFAYVWRDFSCRMKVDAS